MPHSSQAYVKYAFSVKRFDYLRHIIGPGWLEVAKDTTDAISDLKKQPKTVDYDLFQKYKMCSEKVLGTSRESRHFINAS